MTQKEEILAAIAEAAEKQTTESVGKAVGAVNEYLVSRFGPAAALPAFKNVGTQFAEFLKGDPRLAAMAQKKGIVAGTDPVAIKIPRYGLKAEEWAAPIHKANVLTTDFPQERTYLPFFDQPRRRVFLRDLLPVAGLSTPQLEYARLVGCTNSAGGVAEAAAKPESEIDTELKVEAVKQIATWIPVSRQAVRDVSGLAAFLNSVLGYFLAIEEDDQILNGAGGNDFNGILNDPDVQTQAFSVDIIETIRKAITKVQTGSPCFGAGWEPTAIVMHPTDWEEASLIRDLNDRFLLHSSNDTAAGQPAVRLWNLPVIVTPAIAVNTALVGAFDIGATLWTYDDVTLRVSDSHSDFFVKNLLAVLAEMRELLAIYYPQAFVEVALA